MFVHCNIYLWVLALVVPRVPSSFVTYECIKLGPYPEQELYTSPASEMRGATVVLLALLTRALNPCCTSLSLGDAERQNDKSEHSEDRAVKVSRTLTFNTRHVPITCEGWVWFESSSFINACFYLNLAYSFFCCHCEKCIRFVHSLLEKHILIQLYKFVWWRG